MGFDGKVAIVTGAGTGIGRATALRLAAQGARVLAAGIDAERIAATVHDVGEAGGTAAAHCFDLAAPDAGEGLLHAALSAFGGVDVLANVAAIYPTAPVEQTDDALWGSLAAACGPAPGVATWPGTTRFSAS